MKTATTADAKEAWRQRYADPDELLAIPLREAKRAQSLRLSDAVVKAATRVCTKKDFLERLREQMFALENARYLDVMGQESNAKYLRKDFQQGAELLAAVERWLGAGNSKLSPLLLPYHRDQQAEEAMLADIEAVKRMARLVAAENALLTKMPATKQQKHFLPSLARILCALCVKFDLPKPELSEFGDVVKLMAAISEQFNIPVGADAHRKALAKAMGPDSTD